MFGHGWSGAGYPLSPAICPPSARHLPALCPLSQPLKLCAPHAPPAHRRGYNLPTQPLPRAHDHAHNRIRRTSSATATDIIDALDAGHSECGRLVAKPRDLVVVRLALLLAFNLRVGQLLPYIDLEPAQCFGTSPTGIIRVAERDGRITSSVGGSSGELGCIRRPTTVYHVTPRSHFVRRRNATHAYMCPRSPHPLFGPPV